MEGKPDSDPMIPRNPHSKQFPCFSRLLEQVKQVIGPKEFLSFLNTYLRAPLHTQKLKEEMTRLEREVLNIETTEEEK